MSGSFVVSLDFELYWGVRDKRTLESYRSHLLGVREAVPAMLELFVRHGVRATWAAVGFLFFDGKEALLKALPAREPRYTKAALSPYPGLAHLGRSEREDPFHFAPSLLERVAAAPGQEIGTHTFSHYYCLEGGQTVEDFAADLTAARAASQRLLGRAPRSIVFPRNQFNPAYLGAAAAAGLVAYRGNLEHWLYAAKNEEEESLPRRGVRLLDAYLPISGKNSRPAARPDAHGLVDVPASRFFRPYSARLAALDQLRLSRITRDLEETAERGETYHLWWHPHNFGRHTRQNLALLEEVLRAFARLRDRGSLIARTMEEAAELARLTAAA